MIDELAIQFLELVPKNLLSRGVGAATRVALPAPLQGLVNEAFAAAAGIDRHESTKTPRRYRTLNDFFTRRLEPGARPAAAEHADEAVVPVDGTLGMFGEIDAGTLLQAKGREYSVLDLLDSGAHAEKFAGGSYATFYLSPRDYHRIHSPVDGRVDEISYIPGDLFPVFPMAVDNVDELFAVNERLISLMEVDGHGPVAVVKVGATCVGRISLSFRDCQTNQSYRRRRVERLAEPVSLEHGDEIGVFNLGSTVILLFGEPGIEFAAPLEEGRNVQMGELLGRWGR